MLEAPSLPEPGQYEELGLRIVGMPPKPGARGRVEVDRLTGELPT